MAYRKSTKCGVRQKFSRAKDVATNEARKQNNLTLAFFKCPYFFIALPTTDQMALLKSSWSELYILNTSQHCSIYQLNARSLTPMNISPQAENYVNEQRKRNNGNDSPESSFKAFEELVEKFKNLHTDAAEFSCLKALVLFNPGNCSLQRFIQDHNKHLWWSHQNKTLS